MNGYEDPERCCADGAHVCVDVGFEGEGDRCSVCGWLVCPDTGTAVIYRPDSPHGEYFHADRTTCFLHQHGDHDDPAEPAEGEDMAMLRSGPAEVPGAVLAGWLDELCDAALSSAGQAHEFYGLVLDEIQRRLREGDEG